MIIIQIIVSLLLVAIILLQRESGGSFALGSTMSSFSAKRGAERFLFLFTIALSTIFVILSIIALALPS